ncbi:MAG: hemerythrin domain-containing protein [Candidatus Dormibacteraeota bacterium]|nr:hemerythrin domain-containing protein [Candidatus Dormibacteraeota bacterium]MBV9525905.1 hemerythrin domain-containing protein [Candidatus Dormibacteraeota bacterium]
MNAIALLRDDHRRVKQLFREYERLGPRAKRAKQRIVQEFSRELAVHSNIEEVVFYPQVREHVQRAEDEVLEGLEEHHIVKWTLSELEKMRPEDERYDAKVRVLMESVRHHIDEEERELFPRVRAAVSRAELNEMGEKLQQAKAAAPTRPHPRAPDEPPANVVAAAISAPMDVVMDGAKHAVSRVRG